MDRDTAVIRIRRGLSFRSTDRNDEIIDALKEAQRELEGAKTLPWFMIEEDATLSLLADASTVSIPDGFIKEVEDEGIRYTDDDGDVHFLTKKPFDEAKTFYARATSTEIAQGPVAYSLRKSTIYFWPSPVTSAFTFTWSYFKAATLLTTNVENVWLANVPDLLIGRAGMIIAHDLRDVDAKTGFTDMYKFWRAWLDARIAEREDAGMPRAMGRNR
jgi:hypothetical protein